jgi:hypothetical protein
VLPQPFSQGGWGKKYKPVMAITKKKKTLAYINL